MYSEERQQKEVIARIARFVSRYLTTQVKDKLKQVQNNEKKICDYCKHFCVGYGCEMPDDYFKKEMQGDAIARCEGFWFITKLQTDMTNTELIRQEIDRLQEAQLDECRNFNSEYKEGIFDGLSMLDRFIDFLPKETPQGWISVRDTLPEKTGFYITCINVQGAPQRVDVTYFDKIRRGEWIEDDEDNCIADVDYWMPIPEFKEE